MTITPRQTREREFYDRYSSLAPVQVNFDPVDRYQNGTEKRPWNSYWYVYQCLVDHFRKRQTQSTVNLLDFGCGPGIASLLGARIGYDVKGFDISPSNIEQAKKNAVEFNCADKLHFQVGVAEKLDYPDHTFDVIMGVDILHHVDISEAIQECYRVLKDDGIAIFREPVEAPLFDRVRQLAWVKKFFPNDLSLERHVTADERKLSKHDLLLIKKVFPKTRIEKYFYLSRLDRWLLPAGYQKSSPTEWIDYFLIRHLPLLSELAGAGVIILKK